MHVCTCICVINNNTDVYFQTKSIYVYIYAYNTSKNMYKYTCMLCIKSMCRKKISKYTRAVKVHVKQVKIKIYINVHTCHVLKVYNGLIQSLIIGLL